MPISHAHIAPLWNQYLEDCQYDNTQPMTYEAFRAREERIHANIAEKFNKYKEQSNEDGERRRREIVKQLADELTAEFTEIMSPKEKIVHQLAEKHLKTRYNVSKSNGFQQLLKEPKS